MVTVIGCSRTLLASFQDNLKGISGVTPIEARAKASNLYDDDVIGSHLEEMRHSVPALL